MYYLFVYKMSEKVKKKLKVDILKLLLSTSLFRDI